MFENLNNKTVLITGGSRGIGFSIVKMSIKYGLNVALTYHNNKLDLTDLENSISDSSIKIKKVRKFQEIFIKPLTDFLRKAYNDYNAPADTNRRTAVPQKPIGGYIDGYPEYYYRFCVFLLF